MPSPEDAALLQSYFVGLEECRREAESRWGVGRLELLAGDELRARWMRQCASWSAAYAAAWDAPFVSRDALQLVQDKAAAMRRGWAALEAAAAEAGHREIAPWVWEVILADGSVAALVQTDAEASKVIADGRFLQVYTLAEVGNVIDALPPVLRQAKQVFPGARFQAPRRDPDRLGAGPWRPEGDDIPFGHGLGREVVAEPSSTDTEPWE